MTIVDTIYSELGSLTEIELGEVLDFVCKLKIKHSSSPGHLTNDAELVPEEELHWVEVT